MTTPPRREQAVQLLKAVVLAYSFSTSLVIYNKWLFTNCAAEERQTSRTAGRCLGWGFPYPLVVTCFHMLFLSLATQFYMWCVPSSRPTIDKPYRKPRLLLVGLFVALDIVFTNAGYLFLEASFVEMIKSSMPASVLLFGLAAGLEQRSGVLLAIVVIISVGLAVATVGEMNFHPVGFALELLAVLCGSARLIEQQLLLRYGAEGKLHSAVGLSPIQILYYQAPISFVTLLPAALAIGTTRMRHDALLKDALYVIETILILIAGGLLAVGLNFGDILLIDRSSALTSTVLGTVKTAVVIGVSWITFRNRISWLNLSGYAVCVVGVFLYQRYRQQQPSTSTKFDTASAEADAQSEHTPATGPGVPESTGLAKEVNMRLDVSAMQEDTAV
ncbi:similar to phosphate/phosphoenolpyruvate translocator protein [Cyanidioschyzon merolae strain 10D]|jgi:drug/metabolite transporter (DMT)-like permease|uniref:Similar to phosphate/phosphoenolpyruvate translocator protein n=1 Tax=Cyanidioschyzon merolae (strain NIES-3377 / 10D) TaxID=280699 RepID=M1VD27_CYAM1|nr:similar to phosphate/phosphoenolpyruvate translocator protein [Cyanidioschyzon merolae strain 10D]BAM80597.1 similar to phosphate/phosphoenolpyruvate translocator protein [Cyanidioschyzon merolae strain 10D]|eukprot:XP_005536633.1 similar to phosphate/phosphoenolpyruvate translocator protein [Cyanidioschyzon merolae strain 10D]